MDEEKGTGSVSVKIFDPAILDDLRQLDPQIVKEVIELFFQQLPVELTLMQEIFIKGDIAALSKKAHLLKSSAKQVGGLRLAEVCFLLEKDPSAIESKSRVEALMVEFEALKKELVAYGESAK